MKRPGLKRTNVWPIGVCALKRSGSHKQYLPSRPLIQSDQSKQYSKISDQSQLRQSKEQAFFGSISISLPERQPARECEDGGHAPGKKKVRRS
jgi:hypothetical protein